MVMKRMRIENGGHGIPLGAISPAPVVNLYMSLLGADW